MAYHPLITGTRPGTHRKAPPGDHPLTPIPDPSIHPWPRALCHLLALAALSGCTSVGDIMAGDKVDYRSGAVKTAALDIPPDLTQLATPTRQGTVSASTLATVTPPTSKLVAPPPPDPTQLSIERQGEQRWLKTHLTPEQVWPKLKEFWKELGFNLELEQAELGLIETEWTENRAKLPQDMIRRTLSKVIDTLYSTGERDKFRTRIERSASGSEIYISHRGMVEVYTSSKSEATIWQPRPIDPQLEAVFLQRLMLKLGAPQGQSQAATVDISAPPARARLLSHQNKLAMQVDDNFDRAWRRVGLSLDRAGFTVEDRDRGNGVYFVRYVNQSQPNQPQPGVLSRLFSKDTGPLVSKYRVLIKSDGERSVVTILNEDGTSENGENAKRILGLLVDDLR